MSDEFMQYVWMSVGGEFTQLYQLNTNCLYFLSCVETVKTYIKRKNVSINKNIKIELQFSLKLMFSQRKGSQIYHNILNNNEYEPNCCKKWIKKLQNELNFKRIFLKISKIREMKYKWFQVRLVHRVLATNIILKEMKVLSNNLLTFCNQEKETIEHIFLK